jgi:hypothetical protein
MNINYLKKYLSAVDLICMYVGGSSYFCEKIQTAHVTLLPTFRQSVELIIRDRCYDKKIFSPKNWRFLYKILLVSSKSRSQHCLLEKRHFSAENCRKS